MTWGELIRLLDSQQPIPKRTKAEGAIEFWREWDAGRQKAVWVKRYIANDKYDLRAFNSAEIEWLMQLSSANVGGTYRRASLEQEGTKLSLPPSSTIKTFDCGPTLDDWLRTTVSYGGRAQSHCFVQPESFLRVALGILLALERVHACHFVHCDIHPGNITLPMRLLGVSGSNARLMPCWDDVTIIDFGYSIDSRRPPKTTLPIRYEGEDVRISPLLQGIMSAVKTHASELLKPGERWENVCLDPAWWLRLEELPLQAFGRLDWREDIYQVGRLLADIRDGKGNARHLDGRTIRASQSSRTVDQLVNELPELLMKVGLASQRPTQRPHLEIVEHIQRALLESRSQGAMLPSEFELRKEDFESSDVAADHPKPAVKVEPVKPPAPAAETMLRQKAPVPSWAKVVTDLPLPLMKPLRVAAPAGWQFVVASTPVTWRQWLAACEHNPDLYRPGPLAHSVVAAAPWLDNVITHVSYLDCLAYIQTVNHLCGAHGLNELAQFRLPSAADWALISSSGTAGATSTPSMGIQHVPVSTWALDVHGLAGVHHHLWQWLAAADGAHWAQVRGGCVAQTQGTDKLERDPVDQYPSDYRSPFITLRLVRYVPLSGIA